MKYILSLLITCTVQFAISQTIFVSSLKKNTYCQGDTVWFPFITTGSFDNGNIFKVEVGPATGMYFSQPLYLGEKANVTNATDSIMVIVPASFPGGLTDFAFRIVSTSPGVQSNSVQSVFMFKNPSFSFQSNETVFCNTQKPFALSIGTSELSALFSGAGVSNNSFSPQDAGAGLHYIYCNVTDQHGCSTTDSLQVQVLSTAKPTLISNEYITPNPIKTLIAFGKNIRWYTDSALTQFLYEGEMFDYEMADTGAHKIYVTQTITNCQSPANLMTVTYRPKITQTVCYAKKPKVDFSSISMCQGEPTKFSVTAHFTAFNNIRWYDGSNYNSATLQSSDSVLTFTKQNNAGKWIYYAFEYDSINKCHSSAAAEFSFIVNPYPIIAIDLNDTVCFSAKPYEIQVIPTGGILSGPGIDPNTNIFTPGVAKAMNSKIPISYTVSNSYGCVSMLTKQVYIKFVYLPTSMDMTGYLDSIPEMFAFGDDNNSIVRWYSDLNSNPIHVGEYFKPTVTAIGEYTYFVTQETKGCSSDAVPITLSIVKGNAGNDSEILSNGNKTIEVGPIPSKKYLNVTGCGDCNAEILSIIGSKISDTKVESNKVNIQNLNSGLYLLKIGKGNQEQIFKFVKE